MRICYILPSRSRVEKFFKTIENIEDMSYSDNFFIIAKLDEDDETMNTDEVKERLKDFSTVTVKWGLSKNKVHACNRGLEDLPECDIIVLMSDDMRWTLFGFDGHIREAFTKHFPELDGVTHFPDSHAKERTMTLSIMGANLYKKLGYLYHPSFLSVYADNHLTEMTKAMGKYVCPISQNRIAGVL